MNGDRVRIGIEAPKDTEITRPDMIKTKQDDKVANSNK
jgi:sRNA-binding carbon storage regulator CsrA